MDVHLEVISPRHLLPRLTSWERICGQCAGVDSALGHGAGNPPRMSFPKGERRDAEGAAMQDTLSSDQDGHSPGAAQMQLTFLLEDGL